MNFRLVEEKDASALSEYFRSNYLHFKKWVPSTSWEYHTVAAWEKRLSNWLQSQEINRSAHFIAVKSGAVIAHCNIDNTADGAFKAGYIGYGVAKTAQGQNVAFELSSEAIDYAFTQLRLHRLMANYICRITTVQLNCLSGWGSKERGLPGIICT